MKKSSICYFPPIHHPLQSKCFSVVLCPTCKTSPFIGRNLALERISRSLFASAKWSWSSWSSPSDSWCHPDQVFETWEGDLDRNGAGSYHDLDDDHPQQNSQVIANRIDHHQLQYNPNAKELKMWELMLFQKKSQAEHGLKNLQTQAWLVNWNAEVIRSTGLAQKPCNSQIPRECQSPPVKLTRRDMGREILPPKIFPPSLSHDLASLSFAKILRSICLILWQISRTILAHL